MAIIIRPEDVVRVVGALDPETSNARAYFRRTVNHNSTRIAKSDIMSTVGNIPVIRRGEKGFRPVMSASIEYIEPQPIEIDDTFSAVEMEEFERATAMGKQQLIDLRLAKWAKLVRETTKALCIQAHKGTIDYQMQAGSKIVRYGVDYGNVTGITNPVKISQLTLEELMDSLETLNESIAKNGIGGAIEYIAARNLYKKVVSLAANQVKFDVVSGDGWISIAGYKIYRDNDNYTHVAENGTESVKHLLDDGELMARAVNAGQELRFLRLDDTVQRQAVPLYSFAVERDDHRGTDLYVKSKPFPLINTKGIAVMKFAAES